MGRYQIYVDKAYDAIERRAYSEAIQWCKKALDVDASAPEAHHARGEALDASGMWEEALQAFDRALERDPDYIDALLSKAEILADLGDRAAGALPLCERAESVLAREDEDPYLLAESFFIRGKAHDTLGQLDEALQSYDAALELVPEQPEYLVQKGSVLFALLDWEGAEEVFRQALKLAPESADAHHGLGLVLERADREREARAEYEESTRLDPAHHPPIPRLSRERFEAEVSKAIDALPEGIARYLTNVAIVLEDLPSRDWLAESGFDPQILGVFDGPRRTDQEQSGPASAATAVPAKITLFQRNLEHACEDESELVREIQITVAHEVGHYHGLDEAALEAFGLD